VRFPDIDIELRADAGYGNDQVLRCCDNLGIKYTLGLAGNNRLHRLSTSTQMDVCIKYSQTKYLPDHPVCREFGTIEYKADSWDKSRKVIVKAEITEAAFADPSSTRASSLPTAISKVPRKHMRTIVAGATLRTVSRSLTSICPVGVRVATGFWPISFVS
jgi:hypothetical protein